VIGVSLADPKAASINSLGTLQHTASHCNTLQHTATHCDIYIHIQVIGVSLADPKAASINSLDDLDKAFPGLRVLQCVL